MHLGTSKKLTKLILFNNEQYLGLQIVWLGHIIFIILIITINN